MGDGGKQDSGSTNFAAVRGPQHVHKGVLTVDQGKTGGSEEAHIEIPLHPKPREVSDATPITGRTTFSVTSLGKPYTRVGFGNWFLELATKRSARRIGT
jgi:hypothetical protein